MAKAHTECKNSWYEIIIIQSITIIIIIIKVHIQTSF